MKINSIRSVVILLSIALLNINCASAAPPGKGQLEGVGKTSDGLIIRISVVATAYSKSIPYGRDALWWGTESTAPKTVIATIQIQMGQKKLWVPLSAYSDLSNPARVSIVNTTKHGFDVLIRGGDAAASYEAVLMFEDGLIQRRQVASMEFPDTAWEKTTYSFNRGN